MIDSRAKGRTAELKARDELRKLTSHIWERTPMSGALGAQHKLKGDLYVPGEKNTFCIEVKHYKDDHLTSKVLTSKNPQIIQWWEQTLRESKQTDKIPLLIFKFNRSKWFVAWSEFDVCEPDEVNHVVIALENHYFFAALLKDFVEVLNVGWIQ